MKKVLVAYLSRTGKTEFFWPNLSQIFAFFGILFANNKALYNDHLQHFHPHHAKKI